MRKLIAAALVAFTLATPAMAFDISTFDGIPSDMKDTIARQSGGRITNKQAGQQEQQAGQGGQQQQQAGRQARKKQSTQERAMQSVDQFMNGDTSAMGQGFGAFR